MGASIAGTVYTSQNETTHTVLPAQTHEEALNNAETLKKNTENTITGKNNQIAGLTSLSAVVPYTPYQHPPEKPYSTEPPIVPLPKDGEEYIPKDGRDIYYDTEPEIPEDEDEVPPDEGDPLVFGNVKFVRTHAYWDSEHFDLFSNGTKVNLSRKALSGFIVFLDVNKNGKLDNGKEMLWHSELNPYQILKLNDSNQNGWFDYSDKVWNYLMIKEIIPNGAIYHTPKELGIIAIKLDYKNGHGDMWGKTRQYTTCEYDGVYLYPDCKVISENKFAVTSYNPQSILFNNGTSLDSFGAVMGWTP